jgi:hypothetical protein
VSPSIESSAVYFNKALLCQGESLKVVVSSWHEFANHKILFKLKTFEGELLVDLPTDAITMKRRSDASYLIEINTDFNGLGPGFYLAQLYLIPRNPEEVAEPLEEYLLRQQTFEVLNFDDYTIYLNELFGDEWDDPIYLDSENIEELNSLFESWNINPISSSDLTSFATEHTRATSTSSGVVSTPREEWRTALEAVVLERVLAVTDAAMRFETSLPFHVYKRVEMKGELPHVDLTRYFWLLAVLGPTWTDVFFFSQTTILDIKVSDGAISMFLRPASYKSEVAEKPRIMPLGEPFLFEVVRKVIGRGLDCELIYDSDEGINLLVNRTSMSMAAHKTFGGY